VPGKANNPADPRGPSDELSFEEAVERVEAIVDRIESGQIGLEESLAEWERGMGLLKRCREVLRRAEQRVEELSADLSEFENGPGEPDAPPGPGATSTPGTPGTPGTTGPGGKERRRG
jgi:exodeoxyribonuclease VII small subunit